MVLVSVSVFLINNAVKDENRQPTGFYEPFRRNLNKFIGRSAEEQITYTSIIAGASSGAVGGEYMLPYNCMDLCHEFLICCVSIYRKPVISDQGPYAGWCPYFIYVQ
jgi:hypothetical protein